MRLERTVPEIAPGPRARRKRAARAVLCAGITAFCVAILPAVASDPVSLVLTGHFQVSVDGEVSEGARIFRTKRGRPRLLIASAGLDAPLVVFAGERRAGLIEPGGLAGADLSQDAIELPAATLDAERGTFPVHPARGGSVIEVAGRKVELGRSEPLLGLLRAEDLLARLPEYRRNAAAYTPAAAPLGELRAVETPTTIDVVFGSWCPHCGQVVPRLLKVIQQIDNSKLTFRFHGVPRTFTEDPVARQFKVASLPTFVVGRGLGQPVRLEGTTLEAPEIALASALAVAETDR